MRPIPLPERARARLGAEMPTALDAIGDPALLERATVALLCSVRCPGDVILRSSDLARALREVGAGVVGGFHAPVERECLTILLRGAAPVIICPARGIAGMRLPGPLRAPIEQGRLLLVSPFGGAERHVTVGLARRRNLVVAALARCVVVLRATPGGETERLCDPLNDWGIRLYTVPSPHNANLLRRGARPVDPARLDDVATLIAADVPA